MSDDLQPWELELLSYAGATADADQVFGNSAWAEGDHIEDGDFTEEALDAWYANEPTFGTHYADGFTFVNVYEVDRIYGGPEEGGWYYDTGTVVISRQVPTGDANRVQNELEREWPRGHGQNDSNSVTYCGGDYRVWIEDVPGADYPKVSPHYE